MDRNLIRLVLPSVLVLVAVAIAPSGAEDAGGGGAVVAPVRLDGSRPARYARSLRAPDGTIHLMGAFEITDKGTRVKYTGGTGTGWDGRLNEAEINTIFIRPGLFIGLDNRVMPREDGGYAGEMWYSTDELATVEHGETRVYLPEAGKVDFGDGDLWAGLFFHRGIIELADGSLLGAMYGNFEQDSIRPTHRWSKTETLYKLRAFAVRSTDRGKSWHYLSTLAVPDPSAPDDSEGYNEWTIVRLEDGRLLAVIRTGHFTPMVACWSADEGRTWSGLITPEGLGPAGCDPCLIRLRDGRLALAYGEMVQPADAGSIATGERDTRRRCRLAISLDREGRQWKTIDVAGYDRRSAYPTIFEVEDNVVLYQADLELWRVAIPENF